MPILFITSTHIGDAILSTGLLAYLMANYPAQRFTIACGAPAAKIFAATPRVESIRVIRKKRYHGHWLDLWRRTRGHRWELIVDLRRSVLPFVLRSRRTAAIPRSREPIHRVELIGRTLGIAPQSPVVWSAPEHRERAMEVLGDDPRDIVALAPGASWVGKVWPGDRFAELARRLTSSDGPIPGARILVVGSNEERTAAQSLMDGFPADRVVDAFGVDVLSTFELLS